MSLEQKASQEEPISVPTKLLSADTVDIQEKRKILEKVDKLENHFNSKYKLQFINQEFEDEWRLAEIKERKAYAIGGFIWCVFQDSVCTGILLETSLEGRITRYVLDFIMFLCLVFVYYRKTSDYHQYLKEDLRESSEKIQWQIKNFKIEQGKEAKRQYIWYYVFFLCFIGHQLSNDLAYEVIPEGDPDYEAKMITATYL